MLNQHPQMFASTTSPLADLISLVGENWPVISRAIVEPNPNQYANILAGIIQGTYKHLDKPIVIDKNRLWPRFIPLIKQALGSTPKIVCTVRNIPDIMASYVLLIEKNKHKITFIDQDLIDNKQIVNNKNRCRLLMEKYIGHPYASLRMGYNNSEADLLFVEYTDIVEQGQATVDRICEFLGLDRYTLNSENLQAMDENDAYHGGIDGLHHVRPVLAKASPPPELVIGHELVKLYTDMRLDFWRK
jgi:hypothetical protein